MGGKAYKVEAHEYEIDGTGIDDIPPSWDHWFSCGACGETLIDMDEHWFPAMKATKCPHCGELIDWDYWDKS